MSTVITGMDVWTVAGRGLAGLERLLNAPDSTFSSPAPYPTEGLNRPLCAVIPDLERDRPAETLLKETVAGALRQAGLEYPPPGTGLVVGTSSGNLSGPWERWHRAVLDNQPRSEEGCGRDAPTQTLELSGPRATVSLACASGTACAKNPRIRSSA